MVMTWMTLTTVLARDKRTAVDRMQFAEMARHARASGRTEIVHDHAVGGECRSTCVEVRDDTTSYLVTD